VPGSGSGFVEAVEMHRGHDSVLGQRIDEVSKGMALGDLLKTHRPDNQDRCGPRGTGKKTNQLNGLDVAPLKIIDDQQAWTVADHCPVHCIEQSMALSQIIRPIQARGL
jgi:hypothetical protein